MNHNEFLNELLHLEKLQVAEAEFAGAEQVTLFVESTLVAAICPNCNQVSTKVHDLSAMQMIRNYPLANDVVICAIRPGDLIVSSVTRHLWSAWTGSVQE